MERDVSCVVDACKCLVMYILCGVADEWKKQGMLVGWFKNLLFCEERKERIKIKVGGRKGYGEYKDGKSFGFHVALWIFESYP